MRLLIDNMMTLSKRAVFLLSLAAAVCELGNCTEYKAVYDADGRRQCAVGQPHEVRLSTNMAILECLRLCDDNPECVVFNIYDNTTCSTFTCPSNLPRGYQIVEFCKSFRINDWKLRCSQSECGDTTHAEDSTSIIASSTHEYEVTTGETTSAEDSTFFIASSTDEYEGTAGETTHAEDSTFLIASSSNEYEGTTGETTSAEDSTFLIASSTANNMLSVGQYEDTTEEETTYAEDSTFLIASSTDINTLSVGEHEATTDIDPSSPPPTQPPLRDCADVRASGHNESGVYVIKVGNSDNETSVYCDMDNSENWLVFQRRVDGSVQFNRNWIDYTNGFGDLTGNFWLGNEILYNLLAYRNYRLRVVVRAWDGATAYAEYSTFSISSSSDNYALNYGGYNGTAGESLSFHKGGQFSTWDADHDDDSGNMAGLYGGGWWYIFDVSANLNGVYLDDIYSGEVYAILWNTFSSYCLNMTEMKIAP